MGNKFLKHYQYEKGIFADWREPNVIRIAPVPLYNTFEEVWRFSDILKLEIEGRET